MRKFIYFFIVLIVAGILTYKYVYKDHRNVVVEVADYTFESSDLIREFESNSELATQKYLDKIIEINGIVTEIEEGTILLNDMVLCYMIQNEKDRSILNSKVVVKGRFIGYDDLLEEIKIDQVSIVE